MLDACGNNFSPFTVSTGIVRSSGSFPESDPWLLHVCSIETGASSYLGFNQYQLWSSDILGGAARLGTVRSRGWCYQELILSLRVLYFAPGRMTWECGKLCSTSEEPSVDIRTITPMWASEPLREAEGLKLPPSTSAIRGLNTKVVEVYERWKRAMLR